ncbi:MAG: CCC motif membrane protein [Bacteroidetes bacterium]|nr:CCC motif membrane protein [Bacteroidota bacterium]
MENQLQQKLPNATATLILGIISIIGSCCWGMGLISAIIALIISKKGKQLLRENPNEYSNAGNLKAGRICAIVGLCISALYLIVGFFYLFVLGGVLSDLSLYEHLY